MKLSDICESNEKDWPEESCDLTAAHTGKPFECLAYRGQIKNITDPSRGVFYASSLSMAQGYAKDSLMAQLSSRKGRVIRAKLKFKNPFVTDGTSKAVQYLMDNGVITKTVGETLLDVGAYARPYGERTIAAGMRRLGHDGIIYNGGLNEIVDLR